MFCDLHRHENKNTDNYLIGEHSDFGLYSYREKLSWLKRPVGYIPVINEHGEDGFIRIIATSWLHLLLPLHIVSICFSIFLFGMWYARKDVIPGLDKTAISYHIEGIKNTDKDSILLPGLKVLNAKENNTHIKSVFMNPDGNTCYFKYIIIRKDNGDVLYTSGLIGPGKAVTEFDINKKLKAGTYPVKVNVQTYDLSDPDIAYNAGNIDVDLIVAI